MKPVCLLLLATTVASSTHLYAGENYTNYLGVAYADLSQDLRFSSDDRTISTNDLIITIGGELAPGFAVEMRTGRGLGETSTHTDTGIASFENNYFYGAFLRAQCRASVIAPYAQVGWMRVSETVTLNGDSSRNTFSDMAFTAGLEYFILGDVALQAEYFFLSDRDKVTRAGPSVGLAWHF